ncbi:MAG: L,D-transpeptidase [Sphingomonadaceae bacterium]
MIRRLVAACLAFLLAAVPASAAQTSGHSAHGVRLGFPEDLPGGVFSGGRSPEVLAVQIMLDRSPHSPGVIDGYAGANTSRAIRAFERANGLPVDGKPDGDLFRKLMAADSSSLLAHYEIGEADVNGPFADVPEDFAAKAKLDRLAYEDPLELLAEKFHMTQGLLKALNPGADFGRAGTRILVARGGDGRLDGTVKRIEVDKAASSVRAYDGEGRLLASYPATVGSDQFPSPSGSMEVLAVAPEPKYYFDPEALDWGPDEQLTIAAGPNNPVGGTWIDLAKEGYGIHGSPDPRLIGKTASHGCVRLTNWDAHELGAAVEVGATVEFVS